ncbi:arrestin domain-containing protein 3-like [Ruditapes philippinarum]|uniref:arrestin domain-containing protein 3-like n=1 Tax=Ruditapes philippinarum TaxID=129788 RepID=UPI00295C0FAD|nr:arrestin domain-containing protein 3-like [Ruditapes philippinarum]
MSILDKLEISLENSSDGNFLAGQTVHGKLIMTVRKGLKVQGIELKVRGRCHAEWKEGFGDQERKLYETEEYIKHSIIVFGKAPEKDVTHIEFLESGKHVFNYKFDLPPHIPSSFEGRHGYIRYWVKAKIHGVWGLLDQSGRVEFGVERSLDLNNVQGAMEGAEDEDSCVICGCCLNQGTISAAFRINRRGFVSGESILCDAEIYNGSVSSIKSTKLKLYKIITYGDVPFESNTREKQTICEQLRGKIKPGKEEIYENETLTLPSKQHVTSLPGCSFIDIDYVAELKVCCPKEDVNLRLPILIIVGTVPLKNATPPNIIQPIRDIVSSSEGIPEPVVLQPTSTHIWTSFDTPSFYGREMTSDEMASFMNSEAPPPSSVPPIATELDEYYPPVADLSILKRERTLTDIYGDRRRPRFLRIMSAVNEGFESDDESVGEEEL